MTFDLASEAILAQWMKTQRTLTSEEVDHNELAHDADNLTPAERVSFDTRSMRRI